LAKKSEVAKFLERILTGTDFNSLAPNGSNGVVGGTARDSGYTGCSDAFSVFAFLAFLIAVLNILMNNGRKKRRRKRRKREANSECDNANEANPHELQQGINATHHLLEGYVKALGSETPECSAFHLCEAGAAATRLGPVGRSFAKVASPNAAGWLLRADEFIHRHAENAMALAVNVDSEIGSVSGFCMQEYPCQLG